MSRREVRVKIRAWLEERELDGLVPPLRAQVEVEREQAYEPVRPAPRSVREIHDTLDRLLTEAGVSDASADRDRADGTETDGGDR